MLPVLVPPDGDSPHRVGLEKLVGGPERAAAICYTLSGSPDASGKPQFSVSARAGYFLRRFPNCGPRTPRARELYRHIADLTDCDTTGVPQPVSITHQKLAGYLHCSIRAVSALVRELARTGKLPLLGVTVGKQGRASRFVFVCDPFTWAENQEVEAMRVRSRRQANAVKDQARAFRALQAGEVTAERAVQLERAAQRRRDWNLPPRDGRVARFKQRLVSSG